jgi:hypothetical protein
MRNEIKQLEDKIQSLKPIDELHQIEKQLRIIEQRLTDHLLATKYKHLLINN